MIIKFEDINLVKMSDFKEISKKHRYPFIHEVLIEFVLTLLLYPPMINIFINFNRNGRILK